MIAFLDSNALIYYFEGAPRYRQAVIKALSEIKADDANAQVAISLLSVMACRVKPLRDGDMALLAQYDAFFSQVQIIELTAQVIGIATDIRASTSLKTPDCLQAACALRMGTECRFVTADIGFAKVPALQIHRIRLDVTN